MLTKAQAKLTPAEAKKLLADKKIAIVMSRFNLRIVEGLLAGAVGVLQEHGLTTEGHEIFPVPGAFEIPLVAKRAAQSGRYAGIVALGCVLRGETPHFEFVSLAATLGCLTAGLDTGCPVSFGVITVNTENQAVERSSADGFNKGREAVLALFEVLQTLQKIQ